MDPFIRRLVRRLCAESQPLSRNRHFHAFDSAEGRQALTIARRLKSLRRDLLACVEEGRRFAIDTAVDAKGDRRIALRRKRSAGYRLCLLCPAEFELFEELPGVGAAIQSAVSGEASIESEASKTKRAGPRISTFEKSGSHRI